MTDWPKEDRPREKLLSKGAAVLTDAELVAIFLQTGTRGKTALDLARELLTEHEGIKKLIDSPAATLQSKAGVGLAKYTRLQAAIELGRRYRRLQVDPRDVMNSSRVTQTFLADRMQHYPNEVFACLFLDNQLRLISFEELFHGTINEASVYPREIVRRALILNAAKIIIAHNHPSGRPEPSQADRDITSLIEKALELVDIRLIDHIIIGNPDHFSFATAGLL
jgi:DNA repair protein RadC